MKDSEIRDNSESGIFAAPSMGTAILSVDGVRVERNNFGIAADSGVTLTARNIVAARNVTQNFWFRNGGMGAALRATVENSVATDGGTGFVAQDGARVTIRNSAAARNGSLGFQAFASVMGTTTELALDHCLASENQHGILAGGGGNGVGVITVSNSTATNNSTNGIVAGTNGTVRAFGNTVTRNGFGLNGQAGTFRSGGHNFVDGNTTETLGTITPVPTM